LSNKPLVSVITVTYNHDNFIRECINSVLEQSYDNWELIIIDDGSIDTTEAIASSYSDLRIRYVEQPHVGPYELRATYNKGLALASGELIAILEGDDFWPIHTLEEQVKCLKNNETCLSHGRALRTTPDGRPIGHCAVVPEQVRNNDPVGTVTRYLLLGKNFSHTSTIVIRREALLSIGGFKGSSLLPTIDFPTLLELGMLGRFAYVDKILGHHRKHSRSVARVCSGDSDVGYYQQLKQYVVDFYKENSDRECLRGISEQDIQRAWVAIVNHTYLGLGREALSIGNWQQASRYFIKALKGPELAYRGAAGLGIISCAIRLNILESFLGAVVGHKLSDISENQ